MAEAQQLEHFPPLDPSRTSVALPTAEVTVLEDRASVTRTGTVRLSGERTLLVVPGVSPVLQDVSLRAVLSSADVRVADIRVRRALAVRRSWRPEGFAQLEAEVEALGKGLESALDQRARADARHQRLWEMLQQGAQEIPEDAAWGRVDEAVWRRTFQALFDRAREQQRLVLESHFEAEDKGGDLAALLMRMALLDRPDVSLTAWIELDLVSTQSTPEVSVSVSYVVPNALWRPIHRAELLDSTHLRVTSRAAVWQRTGEDWTNVRLQLSTARSATATEPPLLGDDLLQVQRKSEEVKLASREVVVQTTGPATAAEPSAEPASVELPGVDDGGEIRMLEVPGAVSVPSDGRPNFFDVAHFQAPALVERISLPRVLQRVIVRCEATHTGTLPLLAGPVELVRDHGAIGWTELSFVAPASRFELSFGPDDALRISREESSSNEVDRVDKWHRRDFKVDLYLSNLGTEPATIKVIERVPVSEVEEVKVKMLDGTRDKATPDEHGMVRWTVAVGAGGSEEVKLRFQVATAPGVKL